MTNSERESTIKKSTTHVVSGAFDVAHSWTISLSDNWIIAFVVLVVSGAFDVVKLCYYRPVAGLALCRDRAICPVA